MGSRRLDGGWRWLAGGALAEARRDVMGRRKPDTRWWGEARAWVAEWEQAHDGDGRGEWRSWNEVTMSFGPYRDRFARLLESAATQDQAVVLLPSARHCDLDGPARPRAATWGEPVHPPTA